MQDVSSGNLVLASNGDVTYTPDPDTSGNDTFMYSLTDNNGDTSNTVTVTINVRATPDPVNDLFTVVEGQLLSEDVTANNGSGVDDLGTTSCSS